MPDELDLPGNLTLRQRAVHVERKSRLNLVMLELMGDSDQRRKPEARRAALRPLRDRLVAAKTAVDAELARALAAVSATAADLADRDHKAHRDPTVARLVRALRAIDGAQSADELPPPVTEHLTDTCPTCGHSTLQWEGPLGWLDRQLAECDRRIDEINTARSVLIAAAERLLAEEPVTA